MAVCFDICCCYARIQATPDLYEVTYVFVVTEMWESTSHFDAWNGKTNSQFACLLHVHRFYYISAACKAPKDSRYSGSSSGTWCLRGISQWIFCICLLFKYLLCSMLVGICCKFSYFILVQIDGTLCSVFLCTNINKRLCHWIQYLPACVVSIQVAACMNSWLTV